MLVQKYTSSRNRRVESAWVLLRRKTIRIRVPRMQKAFEALGGGIVSRTPPI